MSAYAAVDPQGGWDEAWASVWVETGAGAMPDSNDPIHARRQEIDQKVLANLLRLNHERAKPVEPAPTKKPKPKRKATAK